MLTVSRLTDAQQTTFAQLYSANNTDTPTFWKAVGNAFGQDMANRLQVDGKLGFLTINNASLMQKVHTTVKRKMAFPTRCNWRRWAIIAQNGGANC